MNKYINKELPPSPVILDFAQSLLYKQLDPFHAAAILICVKGCHLPGMGLELSWNDN